MGWGWGWGGMLINGGGFDPAANYATVPFHCV